MYSADGLKSTQPSALQSYPFEQQRDLRQLINSRLFASLFTLFF